MNIFIIVMVTIIMGILALIGWGVGYWFWLKLKPKKMIWKAKVYQVGDGIIPSMIKDGKPISNVILKDLRNYTIDTLERVEKDKGIVLYRLVKLNKSVPEVTSDCVDYWGENNKEVHVLFDGENCTLLKKGYDHTNGKIIFRPVPYDRVNMIINQMSIRKDRLEKDKNVLAEILPYVTIALTLIALVGLAWVIGKAFVEMSENNRIASENHDKAIIIASENYRDGLLQYGSVQNTNVKLGVQQTPLPPSVE